MLKRSSLLGGIALSVIGALGLLSLDATVAAPKAFATVGVCNGVVDDGPAINAALALHNGIVELSAGNCLTTVPINITPGVAAVSLTGLKGQGMFTTTIVAKSPWGGGDVIHVTGATDIRDLEINGQAQNLFCLTNATATGNQISVEAWRVGFISCGVSGGGAFANTNAGNYHIRDSYFLNDFWSVYNADGGTNSLIDGNSTTSANGIFIDGPTNAAQHIFIKNNFMQITSNPAPGISMNLAQDVQIDGNVISPVPDRAQGIIEIGASPTTPLRILNNWFEGAIFKRGQETEIGSNYIPNGDAVVLFPFTAGNMVEWNIHDNQFHADATTPATVGSVQLSNMTRVVVHHNMHEGSTGGIYNAGTTPSGNHVLVEGNIFSNTCTNAGTAVFVYNFGGGATCANAAAYPATW